MRCFLKFHCVFFSCAYRDFLLESLSVIPIGLEVLSSRVCRDCVQFVWALSSRVLGVVSMFVGVVFSGF